MKVLAKLGQGIVNLIGIYLLGAISFICLIVVAAGIEKLNKYADSLPVWGLMIVFILLGWAAHELYKLLPSNDKLDS